MDFPKYDGNIHPDEWINEILKYAYLWKSKYDLEFINVAISLVDSSIKLSTEIKDVETLRNALKDDISFTIFKNTNKRKLQSLKYNPERRGGDTSRFISNFRKLCYNSEINDLEEQKKYLYKSLPDNHFDYISNEFYKRVKNVNSTNELIKEFEDIILEESNLIRNESIVALKHVASGKYLSSIENLCYTTGSETQLIFIGNPDPDPNSLWKIKFNNGFAIYNDTLITLQHIKSNKFLGIHCSCYYYYKSPITEHTEVSCSTNGTDSKDQKKPPRWNKNWKFNHSKLEKLENHRGYLKSNDTINLNLAIINPMFYGEVKFLRSHDIQFTVGNDTFQEVFCHNERLGGNDEWCIELVHEVKILT